MQPKNIVFPWISCFTFREARFLAYHTIAIAWFSDGLRSLALTKAIDLGQSENQAIMLVNDQYFLWTSCWISGIHAHTLFTVTRNVDSVNFNGYLMLMLGSSAKYQVNREIKTRVYGKRQTSDSRLRFLKINNKYKRMVQNNCHVYG